MRIIIAKDHQEMSKRASNIVAGQIFLKPDSVIGLATGRTPLLMYKELIRMHREEGLDFSEVTTFNLDEYIGLPADDINSYHYYMNTNFFDHVNVKRQNINIPDGMAPDIEKECLEYEEKIKSKGGIDLQVLGIGKNGHIGFNEPDVKFAAATHKVKLDESTVIANSRFFNSIDDVPRYAISMGIRAIMHARKIMLMASGSDKAEVLDRALFGEITPEVPASVLQLHPDVIVLVDEECARHMSKPAGGRTGWKVV